MNKYIWTISLVLSMACGTSVPQTAMNESTTSAEAPSAGAELDLPPALAARTVPVDDTREAPDDTLPEFNARQLRRLPSAPWAAQAIGAQSISGETIAAFANAGNRQWCAPLSFEGASASSRAAEIDGGWSVEFDEAGRPGMDANGEACATCGHATFGIAGTTLGASALDAPLPNYADGSVTEIAVEEGVASAMIAVPGQSCVYQVWSFSGEAHLRSLISSLRFVEMPAVGATSSDTQMAELDVF